MKNANQKIFNQLWSSTDDAGDIGHGSRWVVRLTKKILNRINEPIESFLDVGCGGGGKTFLLKRNFTDAIGTGVDFAQNGIDAAKRKYNHIHDLNFMCIDAECFEYLPNSYDIISCFDVLEHLEDWKSFVDQFTLSSRNYILITTVTGRVRKDEIAFGHVRNFRRGEIELYLQERGFVAVDVFYAGFPFFNPLSRELFQLIYSLRKDNYIQAVEKAYKNKGTVIWFCSSLLYFLLAFCSTKRYWGNRYVGLFKKQ